MTHQPASMPRLSRGNRPRFNVSFEFFPPKTDEMNATLWASVHRLAPLNPDFVSVTYGAGGATRDRTHDTLARIVKETSIHPAAHLTCVGSTRAEVDAVARDYWSIGVRHIVALRGDPQDGPGSSYVAHDEGYQTSTELVAGLKRLGDFEISVSAYPEGHPESGASFDHDIDILKAKIDAGATRAITQFFFDNDVYMRFMDKVRAKGVKIPVVPGIVPVQSFKQTANFAKRAGATVPAWLADRFEGLDEDPATRRLVAATVAAEQVLDLVDRGIYSFHFYTMNRADLVYAICHLLGMRPALREQKAA